MRSTPVDAGANHLGDLGFLGNDAGLAFGLSQFLILKEDVLRLNRTLFGHRYLMDRVVPVVERLVRELGSVVSVDTMKPAVMRAACEAGAELINDVNALRAPGALEAARKSGAGVILMHMQNTPADMQAAPAYADVVAEVSGFLQQRMHAARDADRVDAV